ncbi:MAG: 50S ribosomal protein L6 [Patescibacteria group bacterium]|nr:50S ribosomal protein L6 [Patescibacteria group bacterium]
MSKVGTRLISLPTAVTVDVKDGVVVVKGPKGELKVDLMPGISLEQADAKLTIKRANDEKATMAAHGLIRSLVNNAVVGVASGFTKELEINGVGFRAEVGTDKITLHLGFSHPVILNIIEGVEIKQDKNKLMISGIDKQKVGHMAALIRAQKKPEPYKGKGIKYTDEVIHRKAGKAAKTAG